MKQWNYATKSNLEEPPHSAEGEPWVDMDIPRQTDSKFDWLL